jgi:flagellar basal body rod protein FlgG
MSTFSSQIASGLRSLMQEYETTSHNLANSSTSGFKRRVNSFSAELQRQQRLSEERNLLVGKIVAEESIDYSQGQLTRTDRPLDVALEGNGFLTLETPQGPLYTRNGALAINLLNQLVDSSGRLAAGRNGPIVIPREVGENTLKIDADGTVRGGEEGMELGRLRIVEFGDAARELIPAGHGCFRAPEGVPAVAAKNTTLRQGSQENSNVQMMQELTGLMTLSRLYESNINVLRKRSETSTAILEVAKA